MGKMPALHLCHSLIRVIRDSFYFRSSGTFGSQCDSCFHRQNYEKLGSIIAGTAAGYVEDAERNRPDKELGFEQTGILIMVFIQLWNIRTSLKSRSTVQREIRLRDDYGRQTC